MAVRQRLDDLITLRLRADIYRPEMARELGISVRALAYYEDGERALPRFRNRSDYLDAIQAIKVRRAAQKTQAS